MEAKTILRLIKDDITHLEEITDEFTLESLPSPDEVELSLVRARALLRELELLHKFAVLRENGSKMTDPAEESATPNENLSEHEPFELFDGEIRSDEQELAIIPDQEEIIITELNVTDQHPIADVPVGVDLRVDPIVDEPVGVDLCVNPIDANALNISDNSENEEEILIEEHLEVKKTLNETLSKPQQSTNDVLSPEKSDSGYPVMPINSIWDGIGINDRFLYIRELFANSSAKFETTINALDKLETIQDAVNFLKLNFKWTKTDASQKFLVLVKRRFTK